MNRISPTNATGEGWGQSWVGALALCLAEWPSGGRADHSENGSPDTSSKRSLKQPPQDAPNSKISEVRREYERHLSAIHRCPTGSNNAGILIGDTL